MKIFCLLLLLFIPLQSSGVEKTIRLENLKPYQSVRIEWQLKGEYALTQSYELDFHVGTDIRMEATNLLEPAGAENAPVKISLSKEELRELDKALALYREQKVVFCSDLPTHNVAVSLFEHDQVKSKESFNNRCLHSKLSELIESLEQSSTCNRLTQNPRSVR